MASCFYCGQPDARYPRKVVTGTFKDNWRGSHSSGTNTRTYYATKLLCEQCDANIKIRKTKSSCWVLFLIALFLSLILIGIL